jgi:hypothetical protein
LPNKSKQYIKASEDKAMKDNKTAAIISLVAAMVFCGCPGLFLMFGGGLSMFVSLIPGAEIDMFGSAEPRAAMLSGAIACLVGLIFIAVPIVVGVVTMRRKAVPPMPEEPIPPAS